MTDWNQLWQIVSSPDNVPISALLILIPFFTWYGLRQARANDRLIEQLEADPVMAKTHHRKTQPYKAGWSKEVHVWPYLLRVEFLAAVIITVILFAWSITLNAPLEQPSNPNLTMNPAKAPWYFLGLQEMLVYFDPWISGVVLPTLIIVGLMAIPYMDANPLGNGYYTYKQRRFAIWAFCFGFIGLWVMMVIIGTFIRGPGWMWFWPGTYWDHNQLVFDLNRNLDEFAGAFFSYIGLQSIADALKGIWAKVAFGAVAMVIYFVVAAWAVHKVITLTEFSRKVYARMTFLQYAALQLFLVIMLLLPVKMILRHVFVVKYLWETPWFNI